MSKWLNFWLINGRLRRMLFNGNDVTPRLKGFVGMGTLVQWEIK